MIKNNCKDCEVRYLGCHSSCNTYTQYKVEIQQKKDRKFDEFDRYTLDKVIRENDMRTKTGRVAIGKVSRI